jgi:hypothetical protein
MTRPSPSREIEEAAASANGTPPARLRVLFFLRGLGYGLLFEQLLRAMLARGHEVLVAFDHHKGGLPKHKSKLFDELRERHPSFDYRELPPRSDLWLIPATAIRRRLDYLRSLEPEHADTAPFGDRPPLGMRVLLFLPPFRWSFGRRLLRDVLGRLEAGMPIPRSLRTFVTEHDPDVVMVSPLVEFGSAQGDYVRVAEAARIPSVLVVAAEDDLSSKGAIRDVPTLTLTWNEAQKDEAVRLHGLPAERVVAADPVPAGELDPATAPDAVAAIERAAPSEVVRTRKGLILRPLLWLLTPLLAILMPLMRPRATARAVVKALRRLPKRVRTWRRNMSRRRELKAAERRAQQKQAKALAAKQAKAKAQAAKEGERARARALKAQGKEAPKAAKGSKARTAKADGAAKARPRARAAKSPKAAGKQKRPTARKRIRHFRTRVKKTARGKARAARRQWKHTRRSVRRVYNRRYRFTYRSKITRVPARDELPALLNARGLLGRGAEIGVKTGLYSNELLSNWRGEELISIDPWLSADPDEYVDRSNVSQDEFERYYQETCERLGEHGSRSTIWRMTSVEAAEKVPDHSFDFVYIDARHDYDSVLEDLDAWCTKVRPGGILAGHDYVDGNLPQGEFYVKSAVDKFFGARDIPVHGTEGPSVVEMFPTWIVEVPEEGIRPAKARLSAGSDKSEVHTTASPHDGSDGPDGPDGADAQRASEQSPAS